jgi:hypothetical protein
MTSQCHDGVFALFGTIRFDSFDSTMNCTEIVLIVSFFVIFIITSQPSIYLQIRSFSSNFDHDCLYFYSSFMPVPLKVASGENCAGVNTH